MTRLILAASALCVAGGLALSSLQAMYLRPMLEEIPIAKLIANLDAAAAAKPEDAGLRLNLARAHAMAFAEKVESAQVQKGKEMQGAWFGHEPKFVPFAVKETKDEAKLKAAKEHLDRAIAQYTRATRLDPKNLAGKLGLAWCLDQDKQKENAIRAYREVIEEGWKVDEKRKGLPLGGHTITVEASGYLIPLLDKQNDGQEIEALQGRIAQLNKLPRPVTPVVVPVRAGLTAYDMVDYKARVRFDADGSGFKEEWNWFTKDAGILVFDPTGKRNITSALQWFGNVTFWMFWDNGYEALAALDDNRDGVLKGPELKGMAIWIDTNSDAVSQSSEVKTLGELGIVAISCGWEIDQAHPERIPFSRSGVTLNDGTTRPTFDVILRKW